jgi:multimeric flavodoxin WrbA
MDILVLTGSPRKKGNTATLLGPFLDELKRRAHRVKRVDLHRKTIQACMECFRCQKTLDTPGCGLKDDMEALYPDILAADVIVWATPIFTWFCTPEMKAAMDRLFCLSKTYNELREQPMLLKGKKLALITTYGADVATGPDLFEVAIRRECTYAHMAFAGHLGVRDVHGPKDFSSAEAVDAARSFAAALDRGEYQERFLS